MALNKVIEIGMGDGVIAMAPHIVWSKGLGSCVLVTLYDMQRKIGASAHIMLPNSESLNGRTPYQCADTAIAAMLEGLQGKGTRLQDMVAKMAGGARMFSDYEDRDQGIGAQNITSIRQILSKEGIPLIGEDTGGSYGRSIEFHLDSGRLIVRAIGKKEKEI